MLTKKGRLPRQIRPNSSYPNYLWFQFCHVVLLGPYWTEPSHRGLQSSHLWTPCVSRMSLFVYARLSSCAVSLMLDSTGIWYRSSAMTGVIGQTCSYEPLQWRGGYDRYAVCLCHCCHLLSCDKPFWRTRETTQQLICHSTRFEISSLWVQIGRLLWAYGQIMGEEVPWGQDRMFPSTK